MRYTVLEAWRLEPPGVLLTGTEREKMVEAVDTALLNIRYDCEATAGEWARRAVHFAIIGLEWALNRRVQA